MWVLKQFKLSTFFYFEAFTVIGSVDYKKLIFFKKISFSPELFESIQNGVLFFVASTPVTTIEKLIKANSKLISSVLIQGLHLLKGSYEGRLCHKGVTRLRLISETCFIYGNKNE